MDFKEAGELQSQSLGKAYVSSSGVSLEAMKQRPNGFPRYRDKGSILSQTLMKRFKASGLFESPDHRIYSIRHALEKRMLEADIDYDLRCILMGRHNTRPSYGDGGSLKYRREQMAKFTLSRTSLRGVKHPLSGP